MPVVLSYSLALANQGGRGGGGTQVSSTLAVGPLGLWPHVPGQNDIKLRFTITVLATIIVITLALPRQSECFMGSLWLNK